MWEMMVVLDILCCWYYGDKPTDGMVIIAFEVFMITIEDRSQIRKYESKPLSQNASQQHYEKPNYSDECWVLLKEFQTTLNANRAAYYHKTAERQNSVTSHGWPTASATSRRSRAAQTATRAREGITDFPEALLCITMSECSKVS